MPPPPPPRSFQDRLVSGDPLEYSLVLHELADGDPAVLNAASDCVGAVADAPHDRLEEMVRAALASCAAKPLSEPLARFLSSAASVSPSCVEDIFREVASAALKADQATPFVSLAESICDIYPAAARVWAAAVVRAFPHHRKDALDIQAAVHTVLVAANTTRFDEVKRALTSLLWDRLVAMDVEMDTPPSTFFPMDGDDRLEDPMRPKVDAFVYQMMKNPPIDDHIRCYWLDGFEREVLRVNGCRYAPYPLLHACTIDQTTYKATLRRFWMVFVDSYRPWPLRQQSIVYSSSLLTCIPCRPAILLSWLDSVVAWIHAFCDSIELDIEWHPSLSWATVAVAKVLAVHATTLSQLGHADSLRSMRLSRIPFAQVLSVQQADAFKDAVTQSEILDLSVFRLQEPNYNIQPNQVEWVGYFESGCTLPASDEFLESVLHPADSHLKNAVNQDTRAVCSSSFQNSVPSSFDIDQECTSLTRALSTVQAV